MKMWKKQKPTDSSSSAENSATCPQCGTDLSESSAGSPCPACLLQLGLQAWDQRSGLGTHDVGATQPPKGTVRDLLPVAEDLKGKFPNLEILHLVGRGGMGDVYCAKQKSLDRLVALKVIRPESREHKDFAERFIREARAMAQLSHPNIVNVHDFGQIDGIYFFVMEYVDGINLRQMLATGKLAPRQALEIVPAICDALQYAHDKGIVHRDIKPENILVDTSGAVKIADFGLAKLLGKKTSIANLTQANQVMGTMHYMAPEQFERPQEVDHRADIYSLGVVIYELLTGELPLGRFAPPSAKASVDARLDEIVLQTLEKEPAHRYQKVSAVKTDMQSIGGANPVQKPNHPHPVATPQPTQASHFHSPVQPVRPVKPKAYGYAAEPVLPGPIPRCGPMEALFHPQTHKNLVYLLMSFPLGLVYFILIVVGLSLGLGTLVIVWISGFVLLGTFLLVRVFTGLERKLARNLLCTTIPARSVPYPNVASTNQTTLQRAKSLACSRETWAGIGYLLLKFPMGVVSFVLTLALIPAALGLSVSPVLLKFDLAEMNLGSWRLDSPLEAMPFAIVGMVLLFFSLHILNWLAWIHAQWAKLCLKRVRQG